MNFLGSRIGDLQKPSIVFILDIEKDLIYCVVVAFCTNMAIWVTINIYYVGWVFET
jgi:hypothetical protein